MLRNSGDWLVLYTEGMEIKKFRFFGTREEAKHHIEVEPPHYRMEAIIYEAKAWCAAKPQYTWKEVQP